MIKNLQKKFIRKGTLFLTALFLTYSASAYTTFTGEFTEDEHLITLEDTELTLLPEGEFASEVKEKIFGHITDKMGLSAEKIYRVKKSSMNEDVSAVSMDEVSKVLRSISKMEGMMYFSRSRKQWDVLYKNAYRIDDMENKKAVEDNLEGSAEGVVISAMMNDHTFGKNFYEISYRQNKKEFVTYMKNISTMAYGPVKAVKPGDFNMCVYVVDDGDYFIVYMGMYTDFAKVSMVEKRLRNSFMARLEAIFNWFVVQF